jgi:hypothetical protein
MNTSVDTAGTVGAVPDQNVRRSRFLGRGRRPLTRQHLDRLLVPTCFVQSKR